METSGLWIGFLADSPDAYLSVRLSHPDMGDYIDALRSDPHLGDVVDTHGPISLEPAPDAFERLFVSIVWQQILVDPAAAIERWLFERIDPMPSDIFEAEPESMRDAGPSATNADSVKTSPPPGRGKCIS